MTIYGGGGSKILATEISKNGKPFSGKIDFWGQGIVLNNLDKKIKGIKLLRTVNEVVCNG